MMSRSKCDKNLYKSFLEATAIRYSGLALSEISPKEISHECMELIVMIIIVVIVI